MALKSPVLLVPAAVLLLVFTRKLVVPDLVYRHGSSVGIVGTGHPLLVARWILPLAGG